MISVSTLKPHFLAVTTANLKVGIRVKCTLGNVSIGPTDRIGTVVSVKSGNVVLVQWTDASINTFSVSPKPDDSPLKFAEPIVVLNGQLVNFSRLFAVVRNVLPGHNGETSVSTHTIVSPEADAFLIDAVSAFTEAALMQVVSLSFH
jgi:hypothetical protein